MKGGCGINKNQIRSLLHMIFEHSNKYLNPVVKVVEFEHFKTQATSAIFIKP